MANERSSRCLVCGKETTEQYTTRIGPVSAHFDCEIMLEFILALFLMTDPPEGWKVFGHFRPAP